MTRKSSAQSILLFTAFPLPFKRNIWPTPTIGGPNKLLQLRFLISLWLGKEPEPYFAVLGFSVVPSRLGHPGNCSNRIAKCSSGLRVHSLSVLYSLSQDLLSRFCLLTVKWPGSNHVKYSMGRGRMNEGD
jgi:hypothetical protein